MANEKKIISRFQFRRDTTENWLLHGDEIPAAGEPCYDIDLKTLRIGDGATAYEKLPVLGNSEDGDTGALQSEIEAMKIAMATMQADIDNMETQVGETNVVEVKENVTNLTTQVENTKTEIVTVQQTLEKKADAKTVTELQTVVEQKVDKEAVETLETNLKTYVDEQVKTVEVTNIDDGEI